MLLCLTWFITTVGHGDLCQLLRGTDTHQSTETCQLLRHLYYNSFFSHLKRIKLIVRRKKHPVVYSCIVIKQQMPQCVNIQSDMLKDRPTHIFSLSLSSDISYQHTVPKQSPSENAVMFVTSSN